jgi:hypothetical protein
MANLSACVLSSVIVTLAASGVAAAEPAGFGVDPSPAQLGPSLPAAEPTLMPPAYVAPMPVPAPAPVREGAEVSPGTALLLSVGGTVASYALMGAGRVSGVAVGIGALGTVIMPSVGRWYAHSAAWGGLTARALGLGAAAGGLALAFDSCPLFSDQACNRNGTGLGALLVVSGGIAFVAGTLYDFVKAPQDANDYNAHLHNVALVPLVQPDRTAANGSSYGLALAGRF